MEEEDSVDETDVVALKSEDDFDALLVGEKSPFDSDSNSGSSSGSSLTLVEFYAPW